MSLASGVRKTVKNILGPSVIRYVRNIGIPKVHNADVYREPLAGGNALEIGGPSDIFAYDGAVPVYPVLAGVDNCLFSNTTLWTGKVNGRFRYDADTREGRQFVCEATDLSPIATASYDCVLASHCLEHTANPLKALGEIQRVLNGSGFLLAVFPHKDSTFDWRRPLTTLQHMQEDFANEASEDDTTHLAEVLALHDLSRDSKTITEEQFRERCKHNVAFRVMHHHTFDSESAVELLRYAGFQVLQVERVKPFHIVILARYKAPQAPQSN